MKVASVLPALVLLLSGLALLPPADAEPLPVEPSCKPVDRTDAGVRTQVFADCSVVVSVKQYDCVWNCGWHYLVRGPPVTIRYYAQNDPEASSAAAAPELPDPCETAQCQGPECPAVAFATTDLLAYMGPHLSVSLARNCTGSVSEHGLHCGNGALREDDVDRSAAGFALHADSCVPALDCTCDPLPIDLSASAAAAEIELPNPCGPTALCQGPDLQPPPVCVTGPCCWGAPCPPPCDDCPAPGPCPVRTVSTGQPVPMLRLPQVVVRTSDGCGVEVDQAGTPCPSMFTPSHDRQVVGPLDVESVGCHFTPDCTCDPLPIEPAASASAADLPDLPGPPTFPVCVTEPCPFMVCDRAQDDVLGGIRYEFTQDCRVRVWDDVMCEASHYEWAHAGPLSVGLEQCDPGNPPAQDRSAAAAIEPPVQVEVVQCVTDPCPPQVTCTPKTGHVGVFQYDVTRQCRVVLTQDPLPCEGTRHQTHTYGPLTIRRSSCGPGIEP